MSRITLAIALSALGLPACSGSYLYDENNLPKSGQQMPPAEGTLAGVPSPGPERAAPSEKKRAENAPKATPVGRFTIDPADALGERSPYNILFKGQSFDPVEMQDPAKKLSARLVLKSVRAYPEHQEILVDALLSVRLELPGGRTLMGDFRSEVPLSLKRNAYKDELKGRVVSVDEGGEILEIRFAREASNSVQEAAVNPFNAGALYLVEGTETVELGRFNGFAEWLP